MTFKEDLPPELVHNILGDEFNPAYHYMLLSEMHMFTLVGYDSEGNVAIEKELKQDYTPMSTDDMNADDPVLQPHYSKSIEEDFKVTKLRMFVNTLILLGIMGVFGFLVYLVWRFTIGS